MDRAWFAAPLLTVALFVVAVDSASAADEGDAPLVVSADKSDALGVVSTAQSDAETDPQDGTGRRLVDRESSERVDAVVIALWSIAAAMTVMLGIFLWHTSPRRRLRLARRRSTELYEAEGEGSEEPAEDESAGEPEPVSESVEDGFVEEGPAEEGFVEEGPAEDGFVEEGPAEDGFVEEGPAEDGFVEEGPAEDGFVEEGPVEDGFVEEGPAEDGFVEEGPVEDGFVEEGPAEVERTPAEDGSEGSPSLWTLARRTGMRLSRWMGS